jgi:hypothetical protein
MKTYKIFPIAVCLMLTSVFAAAQSKTETFKVSGNCGMCKTRIEKAAKSVGATEAKWDADTKELTVTFESSLSNAAKIQQKIAEVGHDNNGYTATDDVYNKLPGCCKYERAAAEKGEKKSCCSDKCEMKDGKCADMAACKEKGCCRDEEACKANGCCSDNAMSDKKMDCCKDGKKCSKEGHDGKEKSCCKKEGKKMKDGKMDCCKDGKCSKEGHDGKDCCKKS